MHFSFAHMADCHLGSWNNHPELKDMSVVAFEKALDECVREKVDFVLIAGDLFDTALPPVDILRRAVAKLKECSDKGLRFYAIAGSHDFSPTGRTMLHVLEEAGLITYVANYTEENGKMKLRAYSDPSGAKIFGVVGRKGSLDVECFGRIDREIENLPGFKIFMFHTAVAEFRPKNMQDMPAVSVNELPKNMDYYATGHVHVQHTSQLGKGQLVFPNSLFPTEFAELEKNDGGFFIARYDGQKMSLVRKEMKLFDVISIHISADGKTPFQVQDELMSTLTRLDVKDKAVLLKISGILASGKPIDIDMKPVLNLAKEKGVFTIKKSTSGLSSSEFEEVQVLENMSTDEIERKIISEQADQMKIPGRLDTADVIMSLIDVLKDEKGEDETNATYETRIKENAKMVLGI